MNKLVQVALIEWTSVHKSYGKSSYYPRRLASVQIYPYVYNIYRVRSKLSP